MSGDFRCKVLGAYIPPDDFTTTEIITRARNELPHDIPLVLLGDLNADLSNPPEDDRAREVADDTMFALGLEDLILHFRSRQSNARGGTSRQVRERTWIHSQSRILSTDRRMFTNVAIRSPRLFPSDHCAIVGEMLPVPLRRHKSYQFVGQSAFLVAPA